MHGELPQFKRCCFCIPLRRGLIGWGYIRVTIDVFNAVYLIAILSWIYRYIDSLSDQCYLLVMTVIVFIDIAFTILLIVGAHMKSVKIMRVVYIYSAVSLVIVVMFVVFMIWEDSQRLARYWEHEYPSHKDLIMSLALSVALGIISMFVEAYVILLIRSELIKLRHQTLEIQFVNHAADGEARCVRAEEPAATI